MEWQEYADYHRTFNDRMDEAKDRAFRRDYSRLGPRVIEKRGKLVEWYSVEHAAEVLGVSVRHVRALIARKRIKGAKIGPGKGSPYLIPAKLNADGRTYRVEVVLGRRGPKASFPTVATIPSDGIPF